MFATFAMTFQAQPSSKAFFLLCQDQRTSVLVKDADRKPVSF